MSKITITSNQLLAVEGKDEFYFFKKLLLFKDIQDIQVIDIGGKEQFRAKLPFLRNTEGFSDVRAIGFIRDAEENNANSAFESICGTLKKNSLPVPKSINTVNKSFIGKVQFKTGVFIMPNNIDNGMLEDLCLKSIEQEDVFECVEKYIDCLRSLNKEKINYSKAKVLTYLASKKPIVNTLGLAAQKEYWNFDSSCFNEVKAFLDGLFLDNT